MLEQFMISMPPKLLLSQAEQREELQQLDRMLRDSEQPHQWSIENWKESMYLHQDPKGEKSEAMEDEWDVKFSRSPIK